MLHGDVTDTREEGSAVMEPQMLLEIHTHQGTAHFSSHTACCRSQESADIPPPTHDHCFLLLLLWRHRSELRSDRELSEGRGCAVIPLDEGK